MQYKDLQKKLAVIAADIKHETSKAVNLRAACIDYVKMCVSDLCYEFGISPSKVLLYLESKGWLPESAPGRYTTPDDVLDKTGWDIAVKYIDTTKLIQRYFADSRNIHVMTWFNASITQYKNRLFMAYRVDAEPYTNNTRVAICELDNDYQPIKESNWLPLLAMGDTFTEDPRLFVFQDNLWVSYSDGNSIGIARLDVENNRKFENVIFKKPYKYRMEKNWVFFESDNVLYCIYSINPNAIYRVEGDELVPFHKRNNILPQTMRGGSQPVLHNNIWHCFYHGHFDHNIPGLSRQYYMGYYQFAAAPPFDIIGYTGILVSAKPKQYQSRGGANHVVIFPSGAIYKDGKFIVSCGINDAEIGLLEFEEKDLTLKLIKDQNINH